MSLAAKAVAEEVVATLGKARRPVLRKIARKHGYSEHTADTPKNITETRDYQDVVKPVLTRMEGLRDKAIKALEAKDLTTERAKDLADMIKGYTHDIQLLGGKATENLAVKQIYAGRSTESIPRHDSDEKAVQPSQED